MGLAEGLGTKGTVMVVVLIFSLPVEFKFILATLKGMESTKGVG